MSNVTRLSNSAPVWPTHPDGTPKKMGELPIEEQRAWLRWAVKRAAPTFAPLGVQLVADDKELS